MLQECQSGVILPGVLRVTGHQLHVVIIVTTLVPGSHTQDVMAQAPIWHKI